MDDETAIPPSLQSSFFHTSCARTARAYARTVDVPLLPHRTGSPLSDVDLLGLGFRHPFGQQLRVLVLQT